MLRNILNGAAARFVLLAICLAAIALGAGLFAGSMSSHDWSGHGGAYSSDIFVLVNGVSK